MNSNWCVSTFFIILALLAGLNQEQKEASNQQIVLEFVAGELVSAANHGEVLGAIKQKLAVLGIDAIEIVAHDANQLSIRYYSHLAAKRVKDFLLQESQLGLVTNKESSSDNPIDQLPEMYSLVVSDIHQHYQTDYALPEALIAQKKQQHTVVPFSAIWPVSVPSIAPIAFVSGRASEAYGFARAENTLHLIPEVRAGPVASA